MFGLPKVGTALSRAGSIPALAMSGKETQENWALQSVKNGKRRGVSVYVSGYRIQTIESIAKFGKAADCKFVTVGSNPTTFFLG